MKIKGKKIVALCMAMGMSMSLSINTMPYIAYAGNTTSDVDINENFAAFTYNNPQDIIISQPRDGYSTTRSRISILGAVDYKYPIYMNGKEINATEHGFFAEYVDLNIGKNTFNFTNNGKSKSINITRKASTYNKSDKSTKTTSKSSSSTNSNINVKNIKGVTYWSKNHADKYAVAKRTNISRMKLPGGDSKELMMPLASGTIAQIIGETRSLYCLSDYSFVYKSNVFVKNGTLGKNKITTMNFLEDNGYDCTEIQLSMWHKALYNFEMREKSAVLTVYNTNQSAWSDVPQNRIIKNVEVLEDGSKGYVKYLINFQKNAPINGYYVEFSEGKMLVGFKKIPTALENNLEGIRVHIDAGHGGSDTGAKGPMATYGPLEKDINLGIALYAKQYLESKGATVIMTRTDDTGTSLSERSAIVASVKPDFSLSIHCNSMPVTVDYNKIKGFLTFYSFDSSGAAEYINSYIADKVGIKKSSARYRNLAMTRMTGYPAVLFETAFMSNPEDYEWMIKPETQKLFGVAAGEAVESFIKQISEENVDTYA